MDTELVRRGLVDTRARAAAAIAAGQVHVRGAPAATASRQVAPDEPITLRADGPRFVSRGGEKLAGALDAFALDVSGRRCLDAGASTGGFTDCLLQRGAAHVVAVDVGRGQLAWSLRNDERVTVLERTNVRDLDATLVGAPPTLSVADLSFVSLRSVAVAIDAVCTPDADHVWLVKPQFEVGRGKVGKRGVVREPAEHARALREVVDALADHGLGVRALTVSPLRGAEGNIEFFLHARRGPGTLPDGAVAEVVAAAHAGGDA
ncbi:MAG TPA: TlyA family RNA methyltransferase [Acidimicrobiia bacterium]|nr:TlyA family RNA methyltransferase [Acidimicrobiia bacterium]